MDEDTQYQDDLGKEDDIAAYGMRIEGEGEEDEGPKLDEEEDEDLI
jgi:hypothetical protein